MPGPAIDRPIAMLDYSGGSEVLEFFHADKRGSVIAMGDAAGTRVEGPFVYGPYGSGAPVGGEPYKYTGRRLDAETGLYYYRARYYSPSLGRFLQTDPIGYGDDLNMYTYVGNDPTDRTDPTGMDTITLGINYAVAIPLTDLNGEGANGTTAEIGIALSFPGFGGGSWDIGGYATHGTTTGVGLTGGVAGGYSVGGSVSDLSTHGETQTQIMGAYGPLGFSAGKDITGSVDVKGFTPRLLKALLKNALHGKIKLPKIGPKGEGFFAGSTTTKTGAVSLRDWITSLSSGSSGSQKGSGRSALFAQTARMQGTRICPKDGSGDRPELLLTIGYSACPAGEIA